MAGLERDSELTQFIKDDWIASGLDDVELNTYNFLLSFPNKSNPNLIEILNWDGDVTYTTR